MIWAIRPKNVLTLFLRLTLNQQLSLQPQPDPLPRCGIQFQGLSPRLLFLTTRRLHKSASSFTRRPVYSNSFFLKFGAWHLEFVSCFEFRISSFTRVTGAR